MKSVLWPAARIFEAIARARVALYMRGRLRRRRLEAPVISVGNLSAGGTGKTPFVIWLFQQLGQRGMRPAVLTRGYGRDDRRQTLLLDREEPAEGAGDEVRLMLRHGVAPVGVDADRFRAGLALKARADVFLLDDGFQHLALERDFDVVLVDCSRLPWEDDLLPAGRLREPPSALARAAAIVLTRVQKWTPLDAIRRQIRRWNRDAAIYVARTRLIDPAPKETALAFAAVGNPKAFVADLCLAGARVVGTRGFPDHHRYSAADLRALERQAEAAGAETLLTTEKDDVNLPAAVRARLGLPLRVIRMELDVDDGDRLIDHFLTTKAQRAQRNTKV
jgi:tetraacyldisaccharide 4'-kinase